MLSTNEALQLHTTILEAFSPDQTLPTYIQLVQLLSTIQLVLTGIRVLLTNPLPHSEETANFLF